MLAARSRCRGRAVALAPLGCHTVALPVRERLDLCALWELETEEIEDAQGLCLEIAEQVFEHHVERLDPLVHEPPRPCSIVLVELPQQRVDLLEAERRLLARQRIPVVPVP